MAIAFIFNGALTAEQEATVKKSKGDVVKITDYLNDFDMVVFGSGVELPKGDFEFMPYSDYSPSKAKQIKKKSAVKSNASE